MKIAIMVEGKTEQAFMPVLRTFLKARCKLMPKLAPVSYSGPLPKGQQLKDEVNRLLAESSRRVDHVVALTDVHGPSGFTSASDAKEKMRQWVGNETRFTPHAAQHDFEAWLLPYWDKIKRLSRTSRNGPGGNPEGVNHNKPPSHWLGEAYRVGMNSEYIKAIHGGKILDGEDLAIAARACPELKAFLNTLLTLCGGQAIP